MAAGLANFTGDYVGSNFVTITAVPERGTLQLGVIGTVLATPEVRRRRDD